jgi:hypothetical protein
MCGRSDPPMSAGVIFRSESTLCVKPPMAAVWAGVGQGCHLSATSSLDDTMIYAPFGTFQAKATPSAR